MHLVIGGNGFLGSHLVRRLLDDGQQVRVLTRASSDLRTLGGLDVEHVTGDLFDAEAVDAAMDGCSVVYHCAVDTRAWLTDPAPLYRTNVEALRSVLDVAARRDLERFVFTSTLATIGRGDRRSAVDETQAFDWPESAPHYVRARVAGEQVALSYAADGRVPVTAMCVANTYGAGDWAPTPHGAFVAAAALGKLPFTVRGMRTESVGIDDAAAALALAAERGRVGERYIVAERYLDLGQVVAAAASAVDRDPPRLVLHKPTLYLAGAAGSAFAAATGRPQKLSLDSVRLMHAFPPMSHAKAERELGWQPRPVLDAIADGARFWRDLAASRRR
ncbi:NAD-dependent epimerase/dehydratase family protein [Gordonia alkaliphila]|uniref:NAD-dependent epimerase/dehydratase family protein n=1 Tax=Gordonia alkaliphila TaxID=1053547 RepID=UPI001FF12240|nr:NAD-dependent epimerase/dehydratase family protein [Gordonia alkaliphila]MCK0438472.1 NAD-dependent epimerase/dehydratase family protein [Gordonia alkaliphila]